MLRFSRKRFLLTSLVIGFLLLLMHIFLLGYYQTTRIGQTVKETLGVSLSLKEIPVPADTFLQKIQGFKDRLTQAGLLVSLVTKDEALSTLQKKIPNLAEQFNKYGIKNPLPSTILIQFDSQQEFEVFQAVVIDYEDLFQNFDIGSLYTYQQQDTRTKNVINMVNVVQYGLFFVIVAILGVILLIISQNTLLLMHQFSQQISLEHQLGASYMTIYTPFLIYTLTNVLSGRVVGMLVNIAGAWYLHHQMMILFLQSFLQDLPWGSILTTTISLFLLMSLLVAFLGRYILYRSMNK